MHARSSTVSESSPKVKFVGQSLIPHRPVDISRLELATRAMKMRAEGYGYADIGETLGVSTGISRTLVQEGLRTMASEPAEEVRQLEAFKLERLYQVVFPLALAGDGAAVDRCLRIAERKARLLGLDAPAEVDIAELRAHMFAKLRDQLPPDIWQRIVQIIADA